MTPELIFKIAHLFGTEKALKARTHSLQNLEPVTVETDIGHLFGGRLKMVLEFDPGSARDALGRDDGGDI